MRAALNSAVLCLALATSGRVGAATTPLPAMEAPILVTRIDCRIVIDKQGRIAEYVPKTALPDALATRVGEMVKTLRFEPVEVDGQIVNAETTMRVAVSAQKLDDGGMRLAIDNLTFPQEKVSGESTGMPTLSKRVGPTYPEQALRMGLNTDVLVALRFGADGHVIDAAVQQSALLHQRGKPREVALALAAFERASLQVLRQWVVDPKTLTPRDLVSGGYVAYVPVQFRIDLAPGKPVEPLGQWTLETRTVKRVPAWAPVSAGAPQPGASDLAQDEQIGVNTKYRLAVPLAALAP